MSTPESPSAAAVDPLVLSTRRGAATVITLNRPRAINALNSEMFELLKAAFANAATDGTSVIVLEGAGERGFCGGGDIKQISGPGGHDVLRLEYGVDYLVATSPVPVVGFMDGVTMGGGIGLTGHATYRVVTERSRLAMPETRIGIAPDVGGHRLLASAPGRLGEYLALTASEMNGADAIALGFADHLVPSASLEALKAALIDGEDPAAACARFSEEAGAAPVLAVRDWWDPVADGVLAAQSVDAATGLFTDPVGVARALIAALETPDAESTARDLIADAAAQVRGMCPTSIAVTLAQQTRTRALDLSLADVLRDDLRVLGRIAVRPDFAEGVRAQVIDKDRNPKWNPARIEDLDADELRRILDPADAPGEEPLSLA